MRIIKIGLVFTRYFFRYLTEKILKKDSPFFAEYLRQAFEELGPTFIKLGQVISMSVGVLPKPLMEEFKKCQDEVAPFSFCQVKKIIKEDLKARVDEFSYIDPEPLAAASIAQVHGARLVGGDMVVIKVQRPDIKKVIEADIKALSFLNAFLVRFIPRLKVLNIKGIIRNFELTVKDELDFVREGKHLDRFKEIFAGDEEVVVPKIYWKLTSKKILTMEKLEGTKINEIEKLKDESVDLSKVAGIGMKVLIKSAFGAGFFHGDIHGGNVIVLPGNRYGLIDFGIMGSLDSSLQKKIKVFLFSVYTHNFHQAGLIMKELASTNEKLPLEKFIADVEEVGNRYLTQTLKGKNWMNFLMETLDAAYKYKLQLPFDLILIIKQLLYLDGLGRTMNADYDILKDGNRFLSYFQNN